MNRYYDEPYQRQQYQNSYGESRDEGTIEETIRRTATKRIDHSRRPGRDIFTPSKAGIIVALVAMVISAAAFTFTFVSRSSTDSQISQLRADIATMQRQQSQANGKMSGQVRDLSGKISSASSVLAMLSPYGMICSQYLTGPNGGPQTFYFPCVHQKP
jgi:hypothetical protein